MKSPFAILPLLFMLSSAAAGESSEDILPHSDMARIPSGYISVLSGHTRAQVYIDNRKIELETPIHRRVIPAGEHVVRVENNFYVSNSYSVTVAPDSHSVINCEIREKSCLLTVNSPDKGFCHYRGKVFRFPCLKEPVSALGGDVRFEQTGYEMQFHHLENVPDGKHITFTIDLKRKSRIKAVALSLAYPGLGQQYEDRILLSKLWGVATLGAISYVAANAAPSFRTDLHIRYSLISLGAVWGLNAIDAAVFFPFHFDEKKAYTVE
jgi:hypothetical protein